MQDNKLISVIIPCYNYANYIHESINSLLRQSYQNFECIIIDDGSYDSTREIAFSLKKKCNRIAYIFQDHRGPSAARNTGIRFSKGEYIQFLDADDLLEKEKLAQHVSFLQNHPDCDLVYGDWDYFGCIDQNGAPSPATPKSPPWKPKVSGQGDRLLLPFVKDNAMVVSAPLVKKSLVERCNGFDERLDAYEDWDFWLQCIFAGGRFEYYSPTESATLIRLHQKSLSKNLKIMARSNLNVRNKIKNKVTNKNIIKINDSLTLESKINLSLINIMHGNIRIGWRELLSCILNKNGILKFLEMTIIKITKSINLKILNNNG